MNQPKTTNIQITYSTTIANTTYDTQDNQEKTTAYYTIRAIDKQSHRAHNAHKSSKINYA